MEKKIASARECVSRLELLKGNVEMEEQVAIQNHRTKEAIELGIKKQGVVMSIRKINTYIAELNELQNRINKWGQK